MAAQRAHDGSGRPTPDARPSDGQRPTRGWREALVVSIFLAGLVTAPQLVAANASDIANFRTLYGTAGTRLDTCATCHAGAGGLNPYGATYNAAGRNLAAFTAVEGLDSDGDAWTNVAEIMARFFPGNQADHPTFADVPADHFAGPWIEALYGAGVTGGCSTAPLQYCPDSPVTREQMAVFLLKAKEGVSFTPPPCVVPTFTDVPCGSGFAPWIEELVRREITAGCAPGRYCPTAPVTREQMAVFLLLTSSIGPAPCTGVFADVPCTSGFAGFIQQLVALGVTAGCAPNRYCPIDTVTRAQMAVFLVKTFDLPL
jgi:hypothetical protein